MSFGHDIAELVAENERGLLAKHSSWERTQLSNFAELLNGYPYNSSRFNPSTGIPLLRIRDIMPGRTETCYGGPLDDPRMFQVRNGDIVVGMDGDFNARIWNGGDALLNQRVCLIRAREELYAQKFLAYALPGYLKFINDHTSSVTVKHLSSRTIQELPLPYPPLTEQRRIVARVDALFAEIAEGEAALDTARKGLDTFRRALLKAAVTGELTKDWRETNPVTETGHDLLARIKADRVAKGEAKGRGKRAADAPPLDTAALPELPEGWAWGTLGEIADSVRNGTSAAPRAEANANEILRISAVRPLWVDESQIRYLDAEQATAASDATVQKGDLLFTRYNGSADLVGVGAIYRGKKRFYPDKIIRVRLHDVLSNHLGFVELAVNCSAGRKHIAANIKTTAGQQGLSGESLKETPIPIPPPAEAAEILRRVSEALSASADTLSLLDAEAADAARLKQSILKAAFEGRLVPQDPADEPASAMLARLKATPSTATPAKRGRRAKS